MYLKTCAVTCAVLLFCGLHAIAQVPAAKKGKSFEIKDSYGTLIYEGSVLRNDKEDSFEYVVEKLSLRFDPTAKTNSTKAIALKELVLVATKKPEGGKGPYKVLHRDKKPVSVVLNNESPTGIIEVIKLTMPKEVAEKADVIGLSVTDGSMMWPIRQKQNFRD